MIDVQEFFEHFQTHSRRHTLVLEKLGDEFKEMYGYLMQSWPQMDVNQRGAVMEQGQAINRVLDELRECTSDLYNDNLRICQAYIDEIENRTKNEPGTTEEAQPRDSGETQE